MQILKFPQEDLNSLHFFTENLSFPIAAASYNEWEQQQLYYLENNFQSGIFSTETICKWCINHKIQYQILYPLNIFSIIKNPYKYYRYLLLKNKLKMYSL